MKIIKNLFILMLTAIAFWSCEKEIRNIAGGTTPTPDPDPIEVVPVDINEKGFEFLEKMQGHWIGFNRVIADDYDWFAFDYRPISPSQIHGIFEGGTLGNLLTSFFVTDFKNTRTIMARNGGLLNGIYRTSYFVMDSVDNSATGDYYRLVDAEGGINTMSMELFFTGDSLYFNAYTSRLGLNFPPTRHMTFAAERNHPELAQAAAAAVGFPKNEPAWDFSGGFNQDWIQAGTPDAKSATFLAQDETFTKDVFTLAVESGDPYTISDHPYLGYLQVDIERNPSIEGKPILLNLSLDALTDANGYFTALEPFNTILLFPSLIGQQDQFLITYLHPGEYYINATADLDENGIPSEGDITHAPLKVTIDPEGQHQITIENINVQN